MARPSVFDYGTHLEFLTAVQNAYNARGKKISLAQWTRKLGYASPRTLGMILHGQRFPTEDFLFRLSRCLSLSTAEIRYLELLVLRARLQARGRNTEALDVEIQRSNPRLKAPKKILEESLFRAVASWQHFVIYFLSQRPDFREDPAWIRRHVQFPLADFQIRDSLDTLLQLRFLRRNSKSGRLERNLDESPSTADDVPSESSRSFHRKSLTKSIEALQSQTIAEREFGSVLLPMDARQLPAARAMLREFRDEFNAKFYREGATHVYQLNLNLFSYTK